MDTSRLELFSDGVFAIAARLPVVDVSVVPPAALWGPRSSTPGPSTRLALFAAVAVFYVVGSTLFGRDPDGAVGRLEGD